MKVTILYGDGNRKERKLSGKVTLERVIAGPVDHMYLTVPKSRVDRVSRWLQDALSTVNRWDKTGHVWFDVEDSTRESTVAPFWEKKIRGLGYSLTPKTKLHISANERSRRVVS